MSPSGEAPEAPRPPRRVRRLMFRFWRARRGVVAIEFALVSIPFFALLFAIIETALAFWAAQVLETAVADAARRIYTGQFQATTATSTPGQIRTAFRNEVCARVTALFDCSNVQIGIHRFATFAQVNMPPLVTNGALDPTAFAGHNSGPRDIVVVRAALEYPVFVAFFDTMRGGLSNGKRLLVATAAFQNEPF